MQTSARSRNVFVLRLGFHSEGRLSFRIGWSSLLESYQGYNMDKVEANLEDQESLDIMGVSLDWTHAGRSPMTGQCTRCAYSRTR